MREGATGWIQALSRGWIFGSRSRSGISSKKKKCLERELEDGRSAGSRRAQALDKGDLDTGDKRQKVAELFSRETGNNIESKVIDTWYRNHKGKKLYRSLRTGSELGLVSSLWGIDLVRMMKYA